MNDRRPKECGKCGARVTGAFCSQCGASYGGGEKLRSRIIFDVDVKLHEAFKAFCAREGQTIREALQKQIQELLKGGKKIGESSTETTGGKKNAVGRREGGSGQR